MAVDREFEFIYRAMRSGQIWAALACSSCSCCAGLLLVVVGCSGLLLVVVGCSGLLRAVFWTLTFTVYWKGCTLKLKMSILRCVFDTDPHRLPEGLHGKIEPSHEAL